MERVEPLELNPESDFERLVFRAQIERIDRKTYLGVALPGQKIADETAGGQVRLEKPRGPTAWRATADAPPDRRQCDFLLHCPPPINSAFISLR